jgi:molybdopterin-binding protein
LPDVSVNLSAHNGLSVPGFRATAGTPLDSQPSEPREAQPTVDAVARSALETLVMANATRPSRLLSPRDAAKILGISYPTLKQWIYKKKLRTVTTAGGHHRIPESELDEFLHLHSERLPVESRRPNFRQISGRNQLAGRVTEIKIDGLIAQIALSIGGQKITSIITSDAVREMRLKVGDKAAALIKSTEVMIVRI